MRKMKKRKIIGVLACAVLLTGIPAIIYANSNSSKNFEYPLRPEMEEWGKLNHGERVSALQIPESILKDMSTEELVETVLDYPCSLDMFFFNTYQGGFESLKNSFNGIRELFSREDAGRHLLNVYKEQKLEDFLKITSDDEKFEKSRWLDFLETMLAQPEIMSSFSNDEKSELIRFINQNEAFRKEHHRELLSMESSCYYRILKERKEGR